LLHRPHHLCRLHNDPFRRPSRLHRLFVLYTVRWRIHHLGRWYRPDTVHRYRIFG
jgi:hypothetical protein